MLKRKSKMFRILCIVLTLTLILVGCGGPPAQTESPEPTALVEIPGTSPTDTLGANEIPAPAPGEPETEDSGATPDNSVPESYPAPAQNNPVNPATQPPTSGNSGYPPGGVAFRSFQIIPGESLVSYEANVTLISENNRTEIAVGATDDVTGEILIDVENPQNSFIRYVNIELADFDSGNDERDNAVRDQILEVETYSFATFIPRDIEGLPATYQEGEPISLEISGDLSIRQVTKTVKFAASVQLQGDTLTGEAVATISLSDFGIGPVGVDGVIAVDDEVTIKIEFIARP
jgi:polyisoprenoid-binding protein YceI